MHGREEWWKGCWLSVVAFLRGHSLILKEEAQLESREVLSIQSPMPIWVYTNPEASESGKKTKLK